MLQIVCKIHADNDAVGHGRMGMRLFLADYFSPIFL
jgi:hypothetical protein